MSNQVITFGCRLNSFESEIIKNSLNKYNLSEVVVFNTCAVTKEAERQAKQSIRRFKRENPDKKIIVTGCAAQINPEHYATMQEVDVVMGNEEKLKEESFSNLHNDQGDALIIHSDIMEAKEALPHLITEHEGKSRAFIQVQNGCNHRCTFCIIPYGRGNSRSVPIGQIINQVNQLVDAGYNEIVLTGVDITDYGKDLPGTPTLGQMIRRVLNLCPNLKRLRLSSVDVAEIDEDIFYLLAEEKRFMPYLHISLQAGDNMILKRMKRRHTRENVLDFCDKVRNIRNDVTFGADIIAGFPTETDEMFNNSLNLVSEAGLQFLHVFPYSIREGTPAAKMPQLPQNIRKERAKLLREEGINQLNKHLIKKLGTMEEILVEENNIGRCADFSKIKIDGAIPDSYIGKIINATMFNIDNGELIGKLNSHA